jgi:hypothetical protein
MAFTRTFNDTVLPNVTTMNCEAARAGFRTNGPEKAVRITGVNRENRDRSEQILFLVRCPCYLLFKSTAVLGTHDLSTHPY